MASSRFRRRLRTIEVTVALCASLLFGIAQASFAQDHVVPSSKIQSDVAASTAARQSKLAQLDEFFSSEQAREALKSANIDYEQVHNALPMLSDQDLANISARAQQARKDFAAGNLTNIELLFIIMAAVVIILVIAIH